MNRVQLFDGLAVPKIAHCCYRARDLQITPRNTYLFRSLSQIEHRHVPLAEPCAIRNPRANIPMLQCLMPAMAVLVHLESLLRS